MLPFNKLYNRWYVCYILFIVVIYALTLLKALPETCIHLPLILSFIPISYKALQKLKEKIIGTEFFLTIATIISFIGHQEKAMNIVLILMLIAEYLEDLISLRTQQEIESLINLIPKNALIKINNEEKNISVKDITSGMLVIIKTGGYIPVDGIIVHGNATINESSLTGESSAEQKEISEHVFAGTFIESGSIIVKTEKVGADTFFGKINNLVQKAEERKAKISILTDKIAFYLVPFLLICIGITWLLTKNLTLVTTLLVFGSPLELTLITPLAILAGITAAFKNGVLVKGGLALEKLSRADTIIFDKTGTLTVNEPELINIESFTPKYNTNALLKIAAIAEKRSDHVFAKAVLKKAYEKGIAVPDPEHYVSVPGHGVKILYNDKQWFMGNKHFLQAPEYGNIPFPPELETSEKDELSSFYIGSSGMVYGKMFITDKLRADAQCTIDALKKAGYKNLILLSGDKKSIATQTASMLGIPAAYGEIFPDQKLLIIEKLQNEKHIVAMVGDGINDAHALKQADIGIALGAMGMEPAIEAADIVLVTNDLYKIVFVTALSKRIFKVIQQNLWYGFMLIHGLGIALTFLGFIDPFKAALFHAVSDIAILINSARLTNFKLKKID